ncbi:MAG: NADH-quinone oxidoreductase subunit K [Myxococcota bacterium]|jgi:NADH-quinone oxidoreductase subunit K
MVDPIAPLVLSAVLFGLGVIGVFAHRGAISVLLSIEFVLCAAVVALVSFDRLHSSALPGATATGGEGLSVLVLSVATAQAIVGLGLLIAARRGTMVSVASSPYANAINSQRESR